MSAIVKVTGSGQITIPAEFRRKHGISIGDRLVIAEDEQGRIIVRSKLRTADELDGIFKLKPGVDADDDFGNIIRESMEDGAARIVAEMRDAREDR